MHNLLYDPLIGVRTLQGERSMSLPELFAALASKQVEGYTALRAHQADPWHVFLVQLAASIQARRPTETLPTDPDDWRDGLIDLAEGEVSAWELLVDDIKKPAFLQHPWTSGAVDAADLGVKPKRGQAVYSPKARTPDELDVLVTAKNHDVKMARMQANEPQAWLYALLLLQSMSGYLGKKKYGIVRMNGGHGSRPIVSWAESLNPSARFIHEVRMLHSLRNKTIADYGYVQRGIVLTWLHPWKRDRHQYYLHQLEPWFIEAARPVRLIQDDGIIALGATSEARQIGPKTRDNGDVGDPWIPINTADKKKGRSALTLSAEGFTPQRLTDLLFEQGFALTDLQKPNAGNTPGWFIASCLVRGKGTTDGYHQVCIPVPPKARLALGNAASRRNLGQLAQNLLSDAKEVQKALHKALAILNEGGQKSDSASKGARKAKSASKDGQEDDSAQVDIRFKAAHLDYSRRWEALYFPTLWRGAEIDLEAVRRDWQQRIVNEANALLNAAAQRLPLPSNRTWRAITLAQRAFSGQLGERGLPKPQHLPTLDLETMEETAA